MEQRNFYHLIKMEIINKKIFIKDIYYIEIF